MSVKGRTIIAALLLAACAVAASAQHRDSRFESFKREMMPQVGKKITVVGVLQFAKLGWLVAFKDWGVYIYAVRGSDISKMNALNRFAEQSVEVTATLRYFPEPTRPKSDRIIEAVPPEHFYFDIAEARVTGLNGQRPKRSLRRARKSSFSAP